MKKFEKPLWIKESRMVGSWHFLRLGLKSKKTNLDFLKSADNPFAKYLISKVFWMYSLYL